MSTSGKCDTQSGSESCLTGHRNHVIGRSYLHRMPRPVHQAAVLIHARPEQVWTRAESLSLLLDTRPTHLNAQHPFLSDGKCPSQTAEQVGDACVTFEPPTLSEGRPARICSNFPAFAQRCKSSVFRGSPQHHPFAFTRHLNPKAALLDFFCTPQKRYPRLHSGF